MFNNLPMLATKLMAAPGAAGQEMSTMDMLLQLLPLC